MAVLGFDLSSLRDALGQLQTSVRQGVQQAQPASGQPDYLGYLGSVGAASGMQGPAMQALAHPAPQSVSGVLGGGAAYDTLAQMAQVGPSLSQAALGSLYQQASSVPSSLSSTWDSLTAFASQQAQNAAQKATAAAAQPQTVGSTVGHAGGGGGPSTGIAPNVARWGSQAQQAFGDILDPDVMLAIMTNESGGDPNAYNSAGNAYGLFQQVGFGDGDPNWASNTNGQFQAARQLAQQKLAGINAAYAANGLNPDARTRARDFALAWAGHFDYSTGTPNPNSRDVGSGQTAQQLGDIFLANYDRIKAGRQQSPQGGGTHGLAGITPGVGGSVMQEFGPTDYSAAHPETYAYGNAYGLTGSQHPGVDWAVPVGTRVVTPLGGTVVYAGGTGYYTDTMDNVDPSRSGEYMVQLDNGDQLILGHMSQINVNAGQRINPGDFVGLSGGSDGAHIHVEYRQRQADGSYRIIDPRTILGQ